MGQKDLAHEQSHLQQTQNLLEIAILVLLEQLPEVSLRKLEQRFLELQQMQALERSKERERVEHGESGMQFGGLGSAQQTVYSIKPASFVP